MKVDRTIVQERTTPTLSSTSLGGTVICVYCTCLSISSVSSSLIKNSKTFLYMLINRIWLHIYICVLLIQKEVVNVKDIDPHFERGSHMFLQTQI